MKERNPMNKIEFDFEKMLPVVTPGFITIDYDALNKHIDYIVKKYKGVLVDEKDIPDMKKVCAEINKLIDRISAERIRVKKAYNEPVIVMEDNIKTIVNKAGEIKDYIFNQIKEIQEAEKKHVREYFEGMWAMDKIDGIEFGQIYNPKWENADCTLKEGLVQYHTLMERINGDLLFLATLDNPMEANLATGEYKKVLNLLKAQNYARDMLRVFSAAKKEAPTTTADALGTNEFILGMEVKLEAEGVKKEYAGAIYFKTDEDFRNAIDMLKVMNIPYFIS
jgi:hypothetical protein